MFLMLFSFFVPSTVDFLDAIHFRIEKRELLVLFFSVESFPHIDTLVFCMVVGFQLTLMKKNCKNC